MNDEAPSNPVAPTSFPEGSDVSKVVTLSPALSPQAQVWVALRDAARALEAAANAVLGEAGRHLASLPVAPVADDFYTVVQTVNEFLLAKARAGRSDRYLRQLRVSLSHFSGGRARLPISAVSIGDIEAWLDSSDWAVRTQRGYLSDVRTMFNFAVRRGLVERNPASAVELPVDDGGEPPVIHAPEQVKKVLDKAREMHPETCRHLAVRYFAGLRSAEAHRMTEENILLDRGVIEVPAKKAKTRRRRLITIQPNLRAWLALDGKLGPIGDMTIRAVIRASKVEWHHNVTRHSFVSYHLAQFQNAAKTALEAGHTEQMLFAHYRELVTQAQATEFWSIKPD